MHSRRVGTTRSNFDDVVTIARLAVTLAPFWEVTGGMGEGRRWLDTLLVATPAPPLPAALWVQVLLSAGRLALWQAGKTAMVFGAGPALAALRIKYAGNPQGLATAAADLRLSQLTGPKPTPATLPPQQQGMPNVSQTAAEKIALLEEYQKFPTKHRAEITRLTAELEAMGWK